jgi:hypothetical protein
MPEFEVHRRGPIFDGRMRRAASDYADAAEYAIAQRGEQMIHQRLRAVLRHPTGYYESRIQVGRGASGRYVISDGGVIYGPWLEGTGSRNSPVTRFPGYATFRRTKALLDRQAPGIAQQLLHRYASRGLL